MFLGSLPSPKNLQSTTPLDLTRFLVWKDGKGKTKVHTSRCPLFGTHSKNHCKCPTRLAAATVDSTIGKLRAIFNSAGRCGPWNELFCIGNPANDSSVQSYLQFITKEQTAAHISPKQAIPLFFDKLSTLTRYLVSKAYSPNDLTPIQRYIFARDAAFFCVDFFSGDRGSDLGRTLTKEVLLLPEEQGLLFRQSIGKTLRGKDYKTFAIKKCHDSQLCPVANLSRYFNLCRSTYVMAIYSDRLTNTVAFQITPSLVLLSRPDSRLISTTLELPMERRCTASAAVVQLPFPCWVCP